MPLRRLTDLDVEDMTKLAQTLNLSPFYTTQSTIPYTLKLLELALSTANPKNG